MFPDATPGQIGSGTKTIPYSQPGNILLLWIYTSVKRHDIYQTLIERCILLEPSFIGARSQCLFLPSFKSANKIQNSVHSALLKPICAGARLA